MQPHGSIQTIPLDRLEGFHEARVALLWLMTMKGTKPKFGLPRRGKTKNPRSVRR